MKKFAVVLGLAAAGLCFGSSASFAQRGVIAGGSSTATWVPWAVMGCPTGIVVSAVVANYRDNRPLTQEEAWSCGVLYWFSTPKAQELKVARKTKKKVS